MVCFNNMETVKMPHSIGFLFRKVLQGDTTGGMLGDEKVHMVFHSIMTTRLSAISTLCSLLWPNTLIGMNNSGLIGIK